MQISDVAVIGAGLAGLTVARGAAAKGVSVQVMDKGRGLGGRLATRRAGAGLRFDHGAQVLDARDPGFAGLLAEAAAAGAAAQWGAAGGGYVGLPGMSGLAKHLAQGLSITIGQKAGRIRRSNGVWNVYDPDGHLVLRGQKLVMALPAPQIIQFFPSDSPVNQEVSQVVFTPCWALMVAFTEPLNLPPIYRDDHPDAVLARICHDGAKPERDGSASYVAQAASGWSSTHLEHEDGWVRAQLLSALSAIAGRDLPQISHAAVHRWRFATASRPLGRSCVPFEEDALYLCGDWCLGDTAEHAWLSGQATLGAILQTPGRHDMAGDDAVPSETRSHP